MRRQRSVSLGRRGQGGGGGSSSGGTGGGGGTAPAGMAGIGGGGAAGVGGAGGHVAGAGGSITQSPEEIHDGLLNAPMTGGLTVSRTPPTVSYPTCQ